VQYNCSTRKNSCVVVVLQLCGLVKSVFSVNRFLCLVSDRIFASLSYIYWLWLLVLSDNSSVYITMLACSKNWLAAYYLVVCKAFSEKNNAETVIAAKIPGYCHCLSDDNNGHRSLKFHQTLHSADEQLHFISLNSSYWGAVLSLNYIMVSNVWQIPVITWDCITWKPST